VLSAPPSSLHANMRLCASTWRTILPIVEDNPLALCDFRSLDPEDLIPSDRVRPDKLGEVFHLHYNPGQKWYFDHEYRVTVG
jgi:hypothetical protein